MARRRKPIVVASSMSGGYCPDCKMFHVMLYDRHDRPIAECSFSAEHLREMLDELHEPPVVH